MSGFSPVMLCPNGYPALSIGDTRCGSTSPLRSSMCVDRRLRGSNIRDLNVRCGVLIGFILVWMAMETLRACVCASLCQNLFQRSVYCHRRFGHHQPYKTFSVGLHRAHDAVRLRRCQRRSPGAYQAFFVAGSSFGLNRRRAGPLVPSSSETALAVASRAGRFVSPLAAVSDRRYC